MKRAIRPKRCRNCDKILRATNESGLCAHHYRKDYYKKETSFKEANQGIKNGSI